MTFVLEGIVVVVVSAAVCEIDLISISFAGCFALKVLFWGGLVCDHSGNTKVRSQWKPIPPAAASLLLPCPTLLSRAQVGSSSNAAGQVGG